MINDGSSSNKTSVVREHPGQKASMTIIQPIYYRIVYGLFLLSKTHQIKFLSGMMMSEQAVYSFRVYRPKVDCYQKSSIRRKRRRIGTCGVHCSCTMARNTMERFNFELLLIQFLMIHKEILELKIDSIN